MNLKKIKVFSILSFLFFTSSLSATLWIGPDTAGTWNSTANWDGGSIPNSIAATATIPSTVEDITINGFIDLKTLEINSAQNFTLTVGAGTSLSIHDNIDCTAADTINVEISSTAAPAVFPQDTTTFDITPAGADLILTGSVFSSSQININGPGRLQLQTPQTIPSTSTISLAGDAALQTSVSTTVQNITIESGSTLEVSANTVSALISGEGAISLVPGSTIQFNQTTAGEYAGNISGSGAAYKVGSETLTYSGVSAVDVPFTVYAGELSVTGSIKSYVGLAADTTLSGNGSVSGIASTNGTVQAGLNPGEIFGCLSDYTFGSGSNGMRFLINGNGASRLLVTQTAYIGGDLEIDVSSGVYQKDVPFTVLTANSVSGNFDTFTAPPNWTKTEQAGSVIVTPTTNQVITPLALSNLATNPRKVGQYFFDQEEVAFGTQDLQYVANQSLVLSSGGPFEDSLVRLSPLTQAGSTFSTFQNNVQMAIVLDRQFQSEAQEASSNPCNYLEYAQVKPGGFVQPIALFYNQQKTTESLATTQQVPFKASTYGAGAGYSYVLDRQFVFEGGLGYTHTNLNWKDNFGSSEWNSFYLAPFLGWFNDQGFANLMFMWAANFYDTNRRVQFPGIDRTATSNYNSYDFFIRANGGFQVYVRKDFWLRPELTLNYLADVREDYTETGAGGISLQVKRKVTNILQPSVRARFVKEIETAKFCYAPNIYAGWLANIPLDNGLTSARFTDAPANLFFNIQGGSQTTNQLILGAEFFARRFDQFEITANFEADLFSYFEVYTIKAKFEWMF